MLETVSLDQLRVLIAVAETGSFSAAARRIQRAQSAVSHAVQSLETALDVGLFDRRGRLPVLTETGQIMLADARIVVARADEMKARARSIADQVEPELGIAVDAMLTPRMLTLSLLALQAEFPLLPVAVHTEGLGAVEARLLDGTCRLGIAPYWPGGADDKLESRPLSKITLVSVVATSHPLASYDRPIPRRELERHVQLVLTDRSGRTGSAMRGVISPRVWRFADLGTRYEFVRAGLGFCNMPLDLVREDLKAKRIKRITVEGWDRPDYSLPLCFLFQKGHQPGRAASWLIDYMTSRFGNDGNGRN